MPIFNPGMFIGEPVAGATAGDVLSVDSNGLLASGFSSGSTQEVSATADTTTTSTSDSLMSGMTITPASGTYLVMFSTTVDHSAQSVAVVVSIYAGGVLQTASVRSPVPRFNGIGANSLSPVAATNGLVTVNGAQAIEIRWKVASGTGTAHQRTMDILRTS